MVLAQLSLAAHTTQQFHTQLFHTTLSHTTLSHNLSSTISTLLTHTHTLSHTTLPHTTDPTALSNTALSHVSLSHNLSSTISTQLTHTFSDTQLAHTQPSHKQLSYTQLSHTYLFHTICLPPSPQNSHILFQIHSINLLTHTTFSHRTPSFDLSSTISFLFPHFPIPSSPFFCYLLEEVDMWGYPVL